MRLGLPRNPRDRDVVPHGSREDTPPSSPTDTGLDHRLTGTRPLSTAPLGSVNPATLAILVVRPEDGRPCLRP